LFSLVLLELGSTVWTIWMHRFPRLPVSFPAADSNSFRIVVLGGSSALGEPYRPWLSVGQIVAWQLEQADPTRRFECEILAWLGDSLEMQHRKLAAIKQRPGMVIIYSGHNEFAARYEEERDGWLDPEPGNPFLRPIYRASLLSPFCRLAYELVSKNRLDVPPPLSGHHQLIDPPQCSPAEAEAIRIDFESRLEALTAYCEQIAAVPVLIIPPANEADYEPSRSTLPRAVPPQERRALMQDFNAARELEARDPADSARRYRKILDRHPGFAEAHHRLARLLERAGSIELARDHYLAALEYDGLPIRCPAPLRAAYLRVSKRHPKSILIDGRRELSAESPRKLLDDFVIQDTHHPTLRGYVALANAVVRELEQKQFLTPSDSVRRPLDAAACARHFGMDAERWASMCARTSEHYRRVAGYRYDPAERLEKSRRYAEAAAMIKKGVAPDLVGLPGVGIADPRAGQGARDEKVERTSSALRLEGRPSWPAGEAGTRVPGLFRNPLDLPVLKQHGGSPAQESHHGDEVVAVGTLGHLADDARERAGGNADHRADRHRRLLGDDQSRAGHGVNLTKVAVE